MARNEPTTADWMQAEREIMQRRGERAIAADRAKAEAVDAGPAPQLFPVIDGAKEPLISEGQAREMATAYRANYQNYADSPEIIQLLEKRLADAFQADGWQLPPLSADDRLKLLRQQHAAKGN
jgi:hypothetical protein